MKHDNYTQNAIEGPFKSEKYPMSDIVLFWLSGFVCGFITCLFAIGQ
jgi:hypothetical protein